MTRAYHAVAALTALALMTGCFELEPGRNQNRKLWLASEQSEETVTKAISAGTWVGMTKSQLESALKRTVFTDHMVDFSYARPDAALFGVQFDEALVIHRPICADDVWILFRDGKVAEVAPIFND